jgi:hypothetical protein
MNGPASPFAGQLLWIVRMVAYREPDYEEWSDDGAIQYQCVRHVGDFLEVIDVDRDMTSTSWIHLATVAEIRLACDCDDDAGEGGPPITFTLGDPSVN